MEVEDVSPALQQRLGPEATVGLLALLEASRQEWATDVTNQAIERFDVRLTQEIGGLRTDLRTALAGVETSLRAEIHRLELQSTAERHRLESKSSAELHRVDGSLREEIARVRTDLRDGDAALRVEIRDMGAAIVKEIAGLGVSIRKDMADQRTELFKWSFAFWASQLVALGGLMTLLFRMHV